MVTFHSLLWLNNILLASRWLSGNDLPVNAEDVWFWSLGWEDPLEKEMATHFSILAWRISWTEEPGGLQSVGSQRVGHDWRDLACTSILAWEILWTEESGGATVHESQKNRTQLSDWTRKTTNIYICWWTFALNIVNRLAINVGEHVSFWIRVFIFSGYMPRSRISRSNGNSIFSF